MKTIGLLGGMSWESSADYYRIINTLVKERLGEPHSAKCLLYSVDFAEVAALMHAGRWDDLGQMLAAAAERLELGGADLLVVCSNTVHLTAAVIEKKIGIPLLHITDGAATKIKAAGLSRVGLLGTSFTMEHAFYKDRLAAHGIQTLIPDADDRKVLQSIIFDELTQGVVNVASQAKCLAIINKLAAAGAEGVILGCTELPMLISQADSNLPLFDTTQIHAEWAVEEALRP
ncbi:MAG: aspartate/glutamate racemase family protein [Negativicutes bacterium]|nr:aspartate/glutamate racemase family protein [Negativicutes bacterium]